ncbi:ABC transporter permease [Fulvivirga sp. 29W222]|uniref:ABC transporter permease n=1 Tax=Fulvivirga marina TaxID=2494733 RepID=A0A937G0H1_9BACT|nr:ABC transporter permease [Fulvivirga marina]MBL6449544.1 ABC transporter permease [Fulvivirga marina]
MLKNYLKITIRSLLKSKTYVIINVFGLGIAMACCIVAYINYDYNASYDQQHVNAGNVYRVNFIRDFQGNKTKNGIAPMPLGESIRDNIAGVGRVIRYIPYGSNIRIKDELFRTDIAYADEGLFDLFNFPLKSGVKSDFGDKTKIFISSELATKYFGQEDALGKQITQVLDSSTLEFIVAGVFEKMPLNSSIQFDALFHFDSFFDAYDEYDESNWKYWNTLLIEVEDKSKIPFIESELQKYKANQNKAKEDFMVSEFYLDPFEGIAIRSELEDVRNHWFRNSLPTAAVVAPAVMAFLVLLIAIFNFTNTAIAMSSRRLKEIGIRKVMGSRRKQLIGQFMAENLTLCFLAGIVAILLAEILVPAYNQMWEFMELNMDYLGNAGFFLFMFGLLIVTGLLAGSYPAFYISSFEPTSILKGTTKFGGITGFTKLLLTLQYSISLIALISAVAFIQNAKYQEEIDLGFDRQGVIYTNINGENEYEVYKNALAGNSDIEAITGTKHHIMSTYINDPVRFEGAEREVDIMEVSENYMDIMGMTLLEGRQFKRDSETDRSESVIVNETMMTAFGWDNAIGKKVIWRDTVQLYVVGVFKDYYGNGLWDAVDPVMLRLNKPEEYSRILVKADANKLVAVNEFMESKWREVFPNRLYNGRYMDEELKEAATVNNNILKLFIFLGIIATLLSASGLFTMVSLNIIKRMKEIGVRKVLGASVGNIAKKLNKQFIIILVIASFLGSLTSYYMVDSLMASIWTYYTGAGMITFLAGIALITIVSALTVGFKVYNAASMSPAHTLRDE